MTANHAWMLKGWLLAEHAPKEIMEAVEAVIGNLSQTAGAITVISGTRPIGERPSEQLLDILEAVTPHVDHRANSAPESDPPGTAEPTDPSPIDIKKPRKKNAMSPENRAAASERMKAMQAAKKAARNKSEQPPAEVPSVPPAAKPYQPVSVEKLRTDHDEYVGKRDAGQPLTDEDWPDIKAMLAKNPDRRKIAGDYDVDLEDLNFFITSCERREQLGNFRAPVRGA